MATAGREAPITIWDIRKRVKVAELTQYKNRVIALKFSPNGRLLAIGMFDHPLVLIDVANGSEIFSLSAHGGVVCALSFTKDGSCLASGGQDGIARFWRTPEKYYK